MKQAVVVRSDYYFVVFAAFAVFVFGVTVMLSVTVFAPQRVAVCFALPFAPPLGTVPVKVATPPLTVADKPYVFIFGCDEIQMGFYRAGKFWAIENFGIEPDIIVFGKALTNGLNPLSGVWAREELIAPNVFPPGSTHSTFSSNTLGTAVALENVRMMEEGNYEEITQRKGAYFLAHLHDLKRKYPKIIGDVDGMGMALRIELCQADGCTPDRELTDKIFAEGMKGDLDVRGKKMGLVLDVGGYYKNVFTLAPSFEMTTEEIDLSCEMLEMLFRRCAPDRM